MQEASARVEAVRHLLRVFPQVYMVPCPGDVLRVGVAYRCFIAEAEARGVKRDGTLGPWVERSLRRRYFARRMRASNPALPPATLLDGRWAWEDWTIVADLVRRNGGSGNQSGHGEGAGPARPDRAEGGADTGGAGEH